MFENGKPTGENIETMPENLFEAGASTADDVNVTENEQATEKVNEAESAAEEKAENTGSEDGITVRYNGKDVFVPTADIARHVQKGMNYDHVFAEHQEYSGILDSIARENGMDRKGFLAHLQNQQRQNALDGAVEDLREKFPEMSDNALQEMAQLKLTSDGLERQKQMEAEVKAKNQEQVNSWRRLFEAYPDVRVETMPKAIFEKVEAGKNPMEAYQEYRIEELSAQLNAEKTNKDNKNKAVGSLASDHKEEETDPFLMGLNGKH